MNARSLLFLAFLTALSAGGVGYAAEADALLADAEVSKIASAVPAAAPAKGKAGRRVLVFVEGRDRLVRKRDGVWYTAHRSSRHCGRAVAAMGRKTGAFEAVVTDDARHFEPDRLEAFDAVVIANAYLEGRLFAMNDNAHQRLASRRKALVEFVRGGKGLVAVHVALAEAVGWAEYNELVGGTHAGHAWHAHQTSTLRIDDPGHPVAAALGEKTLRIADDIYRVGAPYSREAVRVLASVKLDAAPPSQTAYRADGDYPVSWVKPAGDGRVFATTLGHSEATYSNKAFLAHLLAGVQFALGDLPAEAAPQPGTKPPAPEKPLPAVAGWKSLFNGKDFTHWQHGAKYEEHWVARDGMMAFDGKGPSLPTEKKYGDFRFKVDWRLVVPGDSGVFVRGSGRYQMNIWTWAMGSGEMWSLRKGAKTPEETKVYTPSTNADKPVGEWNTFVITVADDKVTCEVNGVTVIDKAPLKGAKPEGTIILQRHGNPIDFKHPYVDETVREQ